jgi:hypothetical protein
MVDYFLFARHPDGIATGIVEREFCVVIHEKQLLEAEIDESVIDFANKPIRVIR